MKLKYLLKEAKYYNSLGKGHLKRMARKFVLTKTPAYRIVNTGPYNYIYKKRVNKQIDCMHPFILQIENTNFCNAKCIMCPHTIMKRKESSMSFDDFVKICENVLPYEKITLITITGFGEPFMDSGIIEKIKWLNKNYPKIEIDIYTNASLLRKDIVNKLLSLKLHKINFSINGTENSYYKIMKLNYEKTKANILYFLEKKEELSLKYPLTNISLMILKENQKEIEKIIAFWKDKVDSIMAYAPSDWAGKLKGISFVTRNPFIEKRWPCLALWNSITVDVEGNVIMCCRDYESIVKFGNLIKTNIQEIRNSLKFRNLLEKQAKHDFKTPICAQCDNSFDSSLNWW